jgi:hypothetical protein
LTMAKAKVSEKMQRAVRKLQSRIGSPNQQYQNLSSDESSPRSGSYLRGRSFLSRSGRFSSCSDLESDEENSESPPSDVPEGFLAVYVGQERQRFVINADYLKHQMFKVLLEKSAEEYGFGHQGGLPIACEVTYFEHLLWSLQTKDPSLRRTDVNACSCFSPYSYPR